MRPVYIRSAELGAPLSDKPALPLRETMASAAARAIAEAGLAPADIDAFFVAAMGSFPHEHFMGGLPLALASQLGLERADVSPMLIGSSESGAWALRSAVQALRHDDSRNHVLVVSGEQMNPLAGQRPRDPEALREERLARNRTIAQVVDEADRTYGLNMLRMSDLIMDLLTHLHDWPLEELTDLVLPFVTLEKYRRVRRYPFGQFHANRKNTVADVHRSARLTHYFRLDDVTPTSSGAVALVLSSRPDGPKRTVEVLAMGQGFVPASLTARRGDPTRMQSVRDAYLRATAAAGVDLRWLLDCDFAVIHDAFPSIEYFFLRELGLGPADIVRRMTSGWSNPFGGLKGCGHALGASGMLQVAKSFHAFTADTRYITSPEPPPSPFPELVRRAPFRTAFTTSVGGVLTNVLVTLLAAHDHAPPATRAERPRTPPHTDDATSASSSSEPSSGAFRLLARTRLRHDPMLGDDQLPLTRNVRNPWIVLLEAADAGTSRTRRLAWTTERFEVGTLVRAVPANLDGQLLWRAEALEAPRPAEPYTECPFDLERIHFLVDLERRLHEVGHGSQPLDFLPVPEPDPSAALLVYARIPDRHDDGDDSSPVLTLKARLVENHGAFRSGAVVALQVVERASAPTVAEHALRAWRARRGVVHPALARIVDLGEHPQGRVYCAREWVEGVALANLVGSAQSHPRALAWAQAIAGALAALHAADLRHGALDPRCVLITARDHAFLLEPQAPAATHAVSLEDDLRGLGQVLLALAVLDPTHRAPLSRVAARCLGWSAPLTSAAAALDALTATDNRSRP